MELTRILLFPLRLARVIVLLPFLLLTVISYYREILSEVKHGTPTEVIQQKVTADVESQGKYTWQEYAVSIFCWWILYVVYMAIKLLL